MPWTNSSGGNGTGGPKGPWNRGPSSPGGGGPPDFEEMLRRSQDRLRRLLPGPGFGTTGLIIVLLLVAIGWLATGVYFVGAFEQGIVLRFGRYVERTPPGVHMHLPWPIETNYTLDV